MNQLIADGPLGSSSAGINDRTNVLFIDFESYFSTKDKYDLKHISIVQYVRDNRFIAHGLGVAGSTGNPIWIAGKDIPEWCKTIDWDKAIVVGHQNKFDSFILKDRYGVSAGQYICTKSMSRAVNGKSIKSHSLSALASHYELESKGIMKTDGLRDLTQDQEAELATYCLHDVELCRDIYMKLKPDFPAGQYQHMNRTIEMFVSPKLVLNVPLLQTTATIEAARRDSIFEEMGIDKKEFASNVKFPALLEARGYEVPKKTSPRTGKEIPALALGDVEFIEMAESEDEELKLLCEARIAAKSTLLETRSAKLAAIGATGAWPFDVEFSGAEQTHRFSGGGGAGGNPQNFTRDSALREAVQAPEGYSLVVGDFAAVEARLVAYLSRDPGLMGLFNSSKDAYMDFASAFYGRPIQKKDPVTGKDTVERRFGKTAILGLGYSMGSVKFRDRVKLQAKMKISEEEAENAVYLYRQRYNRVPALWEALGEAIPRMLDSKASGQLLWLPLTVGYQKLILPDGLPLRYPNLRKVGKEWVYDVYRRGQLQQTKLYGGKLLENICQALAGILCKEAMANFNSELVGQVHDELHVLAKRVLAQIVAAKLKRAMSASPAWLPSLKLEAEVGIGPNWSSAK